MEHLLATMVSVPPSPGRMPARGIMEHLLATMVSLPASPLSVGLATAANADAWTKHYFF
jgi:hypothetical protein